MVASICRFVELRVLKTAALFILASQLIACGGPMIEMDISANAQLNLNEKNLPLPVVVRVYQLSDKGTFESVTFDQIWKEDTRVLGNTLLTRNEMIVNPGANDYLEVDRHRQAKYVGIVAIFRNPIEKKWRDTFELSDNFVGRRLDSNFAVNLVGSTLHITQ